MKNDDEFQSEDAQRSLHVRRFAALARAASDPRLARGAVAVFAAILAHYNPKVGKAWPGTATLMRMARLSRRATIDSVAALERYGYIKVTRPPPMHVGAKRIASEFVPVLPTSELDCTSEVDRTSEVESTRLVQSSAQTSAADRTPISLKSNLFIEPLEERTPANVVSIDRKTNAGTPFERFWTVYPRSEGKKAAAKAWSKNRLDEHADAIIQHVRERIEGDPGWSDPKFIPHAATFLNGERWHDDWRAKTTRTPTPQSKTGQALFQLERMKNDEREIPQLGTGTHATLALPRP